MQDRFKNVPVMKKEPFGERSQHKPDSSQEVVFLPPAPAAWLLSLPPPHVDVSS